MNSRGGDLQGGQTKPNYKLLEEKVGLRVPQQESASKKKRKRKQPTQKEQQQNKRELAAKLIEETDGFLSSGFDIKDYRSFTQTYALISKCLLRAEIDEDFKFATKTASTLAYIGSIILQGLDREQKLVGVNAAMEEQFRTLAAGNIDLTPAQAALILKQQEIPTQLRLLEKFCRENAAEMQTADVIDITPVEPEPNQEKKEHESDEFAF